MQEAERDGKDPDAALAEWEKGAYDPVADFFDDVTSFGGDRARSGQTLNPQTFDTNQRAGTQRRGGYGARQSDRSRAPRNGNWSRGTADTSRDGDSQGERYSGRRDTETQSRSGYTRYRRPTREITRPKALE
ncbi:hypothetical protein KIPB_004824 [Kipferlia bialata]|uniref:Uncharacterized protein n=1 Tax=Kipferlia bialata TaxID=797122 RepID=A0A391P276_9EUKA|nr:hypothetical protein KIPB_004824 [Kipferlia bialata]|eukprot:g4824.t1